MRLGDLWAKHGVGTLQPDSAETRELFIFGVTDDSRDVRYGYLFCALPGAKDNGLAFCSQAAAKGAQAIAVPIAAPNPRPSAPSQLTGVDPTFAPAVPSRSSSRSDLLEKTGCPVGTTKHPPCFMRRVLREDKVFSKASLTGL